MLEEGLLRKEAEDDPTDHSTPIPENKRSPGGSRYVKNGDYYPKKQEIENLGDFPVFGNYSIFFLLLFEVVILPMMGNMTFMVYGGMVIFKMLIILTKLLY